MGGSANRRAVPVAGDIRDERHCAALVDRASQIGSAIINTASIQAFDSSPSLLAYAPTKAAIVNFTKAQLAMKQGVRVNAVAPGPVWTPLIPSTMLRQSIENFGQALPSSARRSR